MMSNDLKDAALLELEEGDYVSAIWSIGCPKRDFLAVLYRKKDGPFKVFIRERAYADDRVWDSKDRKAMYEMSGGSAEPIDELKLFFTADLWARALLYVMGEGAEIHFASVRSSDYEKIKEGFLKLKGTNLIEFDNDMPRN